VSASLLLRRRRSFFDQRAGYLERHGLDAEELCAEKPGLIHVRVVLYGP
jgi:crotonobetainyl-CoA:carnitine CoA-transferase CaiB-like acyl-CoA transferase